MLNTAHGDNPAGLQGLYAAAQLRASRALLLEPDSICVFGGSVAGMLAMCWRLHGVDTAMRTAWQAGVVLTGISAGSSCWHVGGTPDSFAPSCGRSPMGWH